MKVRWLTLVLPWLINFKWTDRSNGVSVLFHSCCLGMNCSSQLDLLPSLLWFLAAQLPTRNFVLHGQDLGMGQLVREVATRGVFLGVQGTPNPQPSAHPYNSLQVYVFLPGNQQFHTVLDGDSSLLLLVTSSCYPDPPGNYSTATHVLVADLGGPRVSLRRLQRPAHMVIEFVTITEYDPTTRVWRQDLWHPPPSLLKASLQGVTLKLAVTAPAEMKVEEINRRFVNSLAALYWAPLVNQFHFRLKLEIVREPPGQADFNSVRRTMQAFTKGDMDVISALYLINAERVEKLAFILVGLEVNFHLIVRRPEYESSWLAIVRPLASLSWWAVLGMVVLAGSALHLLAARAPVLHGVPDLTSSVFVAYGFFCNQACLGTLRSLSMQIACVAALLFFYAINQFYVSNLYSILSTRELTYPFYSLEDFVQKGTHKLVMHPDTSVYTAFQSANDGILREVWEKFMRNDPGHAINGTNIASVMDQVCRGDTAVFALPLQMVGFSTPSCPLQAVPKGYFPNAMGLAARKDFPYVRHFRSLFLRATEAGLSSYLKRKYISSMMPAIKKTDLSIDPVPVSLYQVLFLFLLFGAAVAISLIILIAENLYFARSHRRSLARCARYKMSTSQA